MKNDPTPSPEEEFSSPAEGKDSLLRESQVRLKAPVEPDMPPPDESPRPRLVLISGGSHAHPQERGDGLDDEPGKEQEGEEKVHRRQVIEAALREVESSGVPPRRSIPAPAPERSRWRWRWGFLIVGALLGLGVALGLAASRAAPQDEASSIELAAPPGVEVRLDGADVEGARFSVPLDGRPHTLELDSGDGRPALRLELPAQPR